jgi:sugar O-acyltransferase (sialic acid O-acetyltransferase NeuD family)
MKKHVVIVGGSPGARIAAEIFVEQYDSVLFLEPYFGTIPKTKILAKKIVDGINFLKAKNVDYFIATGDNRMRKKNYDQIFLKTKKNPVNCIHKTAYISKSAELGYGNLICPTSVIHTGAKIGNNTIINTGAIIEHDCVVEDYAQVSPNTTLCGDVKVGKFSFISAASVVIPKITVGNNVVVAAGSAVISDLEDNKLYAGVPAIFKKNLR